MARRRVKIGLLYSLSGTYDRLGAASLAGARLAVETVNADANANLTFAMEPRDPAGDTDRYAPLCQELLTRAGVRHIIGCITSWSRKEVIPVLEKHEGTLWYAAPYEGFEASDRVVYMHACPNQHLVPLLTHVVPRWGANAVIVGSNYIWGWETARLARDLVWDVGGQVLSERYLALGDTDVERLVAEIEAVRPSFVLNNLVGSSSFAFLKAFRALAERDARFAPGRCPIISCNLTEAELAEVGPAADGLLSVGPYFHDAAAPRPSWLGQATDYGAEHPSSLFVAAYNAVTTLAQALHQGPLDSAEDRRRTFSTSVFKTPLGPLRIDPRNQHATLPVRIARAKGGAFEVIETVSDGLAPDPFLAHRPVAGGGLTPLADAARVPLRVVS